MQVFGVAADSTAAPTHVVSEYLPVSLYDALHRERISLTRRDVAAIATDVLLALQSLHARNESFGASLTSRKVMLGGGCAAKLRRFGVEFVQRAAAAAQGDSQTAAVSSAFWETQYELAPTDAAHERPSASTVSRATDVSSSALSVSSVSSMRAIARSDDARARAETGQQRDLYAFGMLLLEMCTFEKPDSELLNRVSCAEQLDPAFGRVVRLALGWNERLATVGPRRNELFADESVRASAAYFLELLALNEQQQASETMRRSTLAFPSFLHADRYAAAAEAQQIEHALATRESRFEVAVKRLDAVEQELLDEQSNFAVLVRQFETVEREKQHWASAAQTLEATVQRFERANERAHADSERLGTALMLQRRDAEQLRMLVEESRGCMLKLQDAKCADMIEKQGLLIDILKLKDEKRRLQDENRAVEERTAALAARVGGEKEAMIDLEERWKQVTVKWELEQKARRKVERQNEQLHMQLSKMEDERSLYAFELNYCPTGLLDPKQTVEYVLELKEREVRALRDAMEQALRVQSDLERTISDERHANQLATQAQCQLHARVDELEAQVRELSGSLETKSNDVAHLTAQLHGATAQIASLCSKVTDLEDEFERQAKKRVDEGTCAFCRQCSSRREMASHNDRHAWTRWRDVTAQSSLDDDGSASRRSATHQSTSSARPATAKSARRELRRSARRLRVDASRVARRHIGGNEVSTALRLERLRYAATTSRTRRWSSSSTRSRRSATVKTAVQSKRTAIAKRTSHSCSRSSSSSRRFSKPTVRWCHSWQGAEAARGCCWDSVSPTQCVCLHRDAQRRLARVPRVQDRSQDDEGEPHAARGPARVLQVPERRSVQPRPEPDHPRRRRRCRAASDCEAAVRARREVARGHERAPDEPVAQLRCAVLATQTSCECVCVCLRR